MLLLQIGERPFRRAQDEIDLESAGVHRDRAESTQDAVALVGLYDYDVVVIDLDVIPRGASPLDHAAVRAIRAISPIPIIGLTTSPDPLVTVRALDLGADDVLTQLCKLDETLARLRAVIRRVGGHTQSTLRWGALEVSMTNREVRIKDTVVRLGPKEYSLLELLLLKRGSPVTRTACLNHLYGVDEYPDLKTVDVMVCRLRKKLSAHGLQDIISNIWGLGFAIKREATLAHQEVS